MSLDIRDFHELDFGLNLAWFENANGTDQDLILWQGRCPDCGEDCFVRLHPVHTQLLAKELGLLTAQEVAQRVARMQDRLTLLAALVRAHSPAGSPLRTAVDALAEGTDQPPQQPVQCAAAPHVSQASHSQTPADLFAGATATPAT